MSNTENERAAPPPIASRAERNAARQAHQMEESAPPPQQMVHQPRGRPTLEQLVAAGILPDGFNSKEEFESYNARVAQLRHKRQPFGSYQQKLAYADRPHYHRHWFNDVDGRVLQAESAGYEHVKDEDDKAVARVTGRLKEGGPMFSYLMEIPKVLHDEDMADNLQRADAVEADIKRGRAQQVDKTDERAGKQPFYVPSTGIDMKSEVGQRRK